MMKTSHTYSSFIWDR